MTFFQKKKIEYLQFYNMTLIIINLDIIPRVLFSLVNFPKTQVFYIYEIMEIVLIGKE